MAMRTTTSHKLFFSFIFFIYYLTIYYLLFIYNFTIYFSFLISHLIFVSLSLCVFVFKIKNITTMKKETWKTIIQIIVTVLSTILGTSVLQSCM